MWGLLKKKRTQKILVGKKEIKLGKSFQNINTKEFQEKLDTLMVIVRLMGYSYYFGYTRDNYCFTFHKDSTFSIFFNLKKNKLRYINIYSRKITRNKEIHFLNIRSQEKFNECIDELLGHL